MEEFEQELSNSKNMKYKLSELNFQIQEIKGEVTVLDEQSSEIRKKL